MRRYDGIVILLVFIAVIFGVAAITDYSAKQKYRDGYANGMAYEKIQREAQFRTDMEKSIKLMDRALESLNKKEQEIARLEGELYRAKELLHAYEDRWERDHPIKKAPIPIGRKGD